MDEPTIATPGTRPTSTNASLKVVVASSSSMAIGSINTNISRSWSYLLQFCGWHVWDKVILLQMGSAYRTRFREFHRDSDIDGWREEQQKEWDRLSVTLGLLATMFCAGLTIGNTPPLAFAIWLGGAGLSICGVLIINYFPVKALGISNADMMTVVQDGNQIISLEVLAAASASPVILALWSSMLFLIDAMDYIMEVNLDGIKYRVIAFVPVVAGLLSCFAMGLIGERLGRRMKVKARLKRRSWSNTTAEGVFPDSDVIRIAICTRPLEDLLVCSVSTEGGLREKSTRPGNLNASRSFVVHCT